MAKTWLLAVSFFLISWGSGLVRAGSLDLQILHASDFEGGVPALQEIPRFSQVLESLKSEYPSNTVILSSGDDYIYGPFFTASADEGLPFNGVRGRADVVVLNNFGVQAAVFGNHEFDGGTEIIRDLLLADPKIAYPGALFPYLAANLVFTNDANLLGLVIASGQDWRVGTNRIAASTVITVAGERIGVVGVTTPELQKISTPGDVMVVENSVATAQRSVDELYGQGVKKIVLLTHLQHLINEENLAGKLTNVSVIVAGGSHQILAKPEDRLRTGDVRVGDYPLTVKDGAGKNVYIVNTQNGYRYVGRFIVHFDSNDVVTAISPKSGIYAADDRGVTETGAFPVNPTIANLISAMKGIIFRKDGNIFGRMDVYLDGRRENIRSRETNLGDLVADAFLWRGKQADTNVCVAICNGGDIRDSIGSIMVEGTAGYELRPSLANPLVGKKEGDISQLDIENALRFNNGLVVLTVTAQQLRDAIEWGLSNPVPGGHFPQISGLKVSFNPTNTTMSYAVTNKVIIGIAEPGNRLQSLVVTLPDGKEDVVVKAGSLTGDSNRQYRIVTLAFLSDGGGGYYPLTLGTDKTNLVPRGTKKTFTTDGAEQRALADYLLAVKNGQVKDLTKDWGQRILKLSPTNAIDATCN